MWVHSIAAVVEKNIQGEPRTKAISTIIPNFLDEYNRIVLRLCMYVTNHFHRTVRLLLLQF